MEIPKIDSVFLRIFKPESTQTSNQNDNSNIAQDRHDTVSISSEGLKQLEESTLAQDSTLGSDPPISDDPDNGA